MGILKIHKDFIYQQKILDLPKASPMNPNGPQVQSNNQQPFIPNGNHPISNPAKPHQIPNNQYPQGLIRNPPMPINYQNPFDAQQQSGYPVQPQQLPNNAEIMQPESNSNESLLFYHMMNIKTGNSGFSCVAVLAFLSILFGGLIAAYWVTKENSSMFGTLHRVYFLMSGYEIQDMDLLFGLIMRSRDDKCLLFIAGNLSLPVLSLFIFAVFNCIALFLVFVKGTFNQYLQAIWAFVWGIVAYLEFPGKCDGLNSFLLQYGEKGSLSSSVPFYALMAILSLASAIANFRWSQSITRENGEKDGVAVIAALAEKNLKALERK